MGLSLTKDTLREAGGFDSLLRAVAKVSHAEPVARVADTRPMAALRPGHVLHERFVIKDRLGAGGMGVVYRARNLETEKDVALKTLRSLDATSLSRFKREFRSLADISHPNLVLLHELVRDSDLWFFTMDLVDGVPFGPEADLRSAFAQLVAGVSAIHATGRIHRDLKPSNVLVTPEGRVVVLDFGLVEDLELVRAERSTEWGGTPAYMAPEQTTGSSAGPATDWFSAGVMLFERLTSRLPWDGPPGTMLLRRRTERTPRPSALVSGVPPDLDELCWRMLAPDPEARPSGEEIRDVIGLPGDTRQHFYVVRPRHSDVFVGREAELAALRATVRDGPGRPRVVIVRGPPGIGKSALLRRFAGDLAAKGTTVLRGRCYARESVPFAALDALVDQLLREPVDESSEAPTSDEAVALLRAFPVLEQVEAIAALRTHSGGSEAQPLRVLAARGLRRVLRSSSRERPFVLWIDDFQWADADSIWLLGEMLAPPDAPNLVLLLTSRESLSPALLEEVTSRGRVELTTLDLGPLSTSAMQDMARSLVHGGRAGLADSIASEAAGHPFFLEVLARSEAERPTEDLAPPSSLDSAIRRRFDNLRPELQRVLTAVAIAGHPVPEMVAVAAAQSSADAATVRALCSGSFLRVASGHQVEPYHDRIRDVIYETLDTGERARWHGRLAEALEMHGASAPEVLARHFSLAGVPAAAKRYAIEGAHRANHALAFDRAAELFALARSSTPAGDPQVRELTRLHAEALFNARRCKDAAEEFLELARTAADVQEAARLEQRAVESYFIGGHVQLGLSVLEPLLQRGGVDVPHDGDEVRRVIMMGTMRLMQRGFHFELREGAVVDESTRARIELLRTASEAWSSLDPPRATAFLLEAAPLVLDTGEPQSVAWILAHVGLFLASLANEDMQKRGAALLDSAAALAEQLKTPTMQPSVDLCRARAAISVGRFREGVRFSDDCLGRAERKGARPNVVEVAQTVRLFGLLAIGEIARLSELLPVLEADARRRADAYWLVTVRLYVAHLRLVHEGDAAGALAIVDSALAEWGEQRMLFQTWLALRTRVLCELYSGAAGRAFDVLQQAWPELERSGLLSLGVVRPDALRLRGVTALADGGGGARAIVDGTRGSLSEGRLDESATRMTLQAGALVLDGKVEEAATLLERARATHRLAGQRLDAWVVHSAMSALRGDDPEPSVRRLRKAGVADPGRWVSTLVPFVGGLLR